MKTGAIASSMPLCPQGQTQKQTIFAQLESTELICIKPHTVSVVEHIERLILPNNVRISMAFVPSKRLNWDLTGSLQTSRQIIQNSLVWNVCKNPRLLLN